MKTVVRIVSSVVMLSLFCAGCGAVEDEGLATASDDEEALETQALLAGGAQRALPTPAIVKTFQKATEGLLFMSESDYPWDVLYWRLPGGSPTAARVAALGGEDATFVEERSLEAFFDGAATPQEWHSEEDLATVKRYQDLVALLKAKLRKLKVYRFGKIQIHAYVVGVTSAGNWVALRTTQIET
jgi:hypothetical protein